MRPGSRWPPVSARSNEHHAHLRLPPQFLAATTKLQSDSRSHNAHHLAAAQTTAYQRSRLGAVCVGQGHLAPA
eukprot:3863176-Amphidinium_carterae.1